MSKFFMTAFAIAVLSSCTFIRIDSKAFKALLEKEGVEFNENSGKAISPEGPVVTEVRYGLDEFDSITSNIPVDIEYSTGEQFVQISAAENILPHIRTIVQNGTLVLKFDAVQLKNSKGMNVVIRCPELKAIEVNGSGDVDINGHVDAEDFNVSINGAGDLDIEDMKANEFIIRVNGAGDINVDRIICESFDAAISGAGDIETDYMETNDLKVSVSGAGECKFAGYAKSADFSVSGAGTIDIRELKVDNQKSMTSGFAKILK